jgi:peptidoglycan hydrolase-like protein with peptidoglycan-binding domain
MKMRSARSETPTVSFALTATILFLSLSVPGSEARPRRPRPSNPQTISSASGSTSSASTTKKKSKKRRSRREPTQKAPTPQRISEIQSALVRGGYYQGEPNGKWDLNTVSAMQRFQSGNGLEPSGKINALSLQKLGLGSEIAGVSAPKPIMPAAAPATGAPSPAHPASPPSSTSNSAAAAKPPAH